MTTDTKRPCINAKRGLRPVITSSVLAIGTAKTDGSVSAWTAEGAQKLGAFTSEDVHVRKADR